MPALSSLSSTPLPDLQAVASDLISNRKADVFIGYQSGTLPLSIAPLIIDVADPDALNKADLLVFDARCSMNLANYLHKHKGRRVAIVVKGCDCRSVVGLIQEKQIDRKNLIIIGAHCSGVVDLRLVAEAVHGRHIAKAEIREQVVAVWSAAECIELPLKDVIYAGCHECPAHNPVLADYLIAAPVHQQDLPEISPAVAEVRALSPEKRYELFETEMSRCILCHACRNLCPACYCARCFADETKPRVAGRTNDPADAMFFHLGRLMHLGGRCTGCGACVRGCPMNVNLRLFNDYGRQHVKEHYDFIAGLDQTAEPPLSCYSMADENDFVL